MLEDAFDAATISRVIAEIDPFEKKSEAFLRKQPGGRLHIARADEITFTTHLVARSPYLRQFARNPVFCDLVHDLIGPDVRLYWDQAVYKKPGTRADFPWHQDNGYTFVEPQAYLTCWVALTDATETNGCPRVVPGLHRGGTLAHQPTDLGLICFDEPPREPIAAPARAGGIVVFSSLTPHATGPNLTGENGARTSCSTRPTAPARSGPARTARSRASSAPRPSGSAPYCGTDGPSTSGDVEVDAEQRQAELRGDVLGGDVVARGAVERRRARPSHRIGPRGHLIHGVSSATKGRQRLHASFVGGGGDSHARADRNRAAASTAAMNGRRCGTSSNQSSRPPRRRSALAALISTQGALEATSFENEYAGPVQIRSMRAFDSSTRTNAS